MPQSPQTDDRRQSSITDRALWEELHKISLELEMYRVEREELRPKLEQLLNVLTVTKGLIIVTRALIYVAAPISAIIYWVQDHTK